jgi:hypothetical protein
MGKAVEEVMVLRRERSNPFVPCRTIHEVSRFHQILALRCSALTLLAFLMAFQVLLMMRRQTKPFFSCYDPRVGLRVSALMYR